jgi:hypothetical protein
MLRLQEYFKGSGNITIDNKREVVHYAVNRFEDLINIIIPQFKQYPLQSAKAVDFFIWERAVRLMENKEHLTEDGLKKILSLKSVLNLGLTDTLKTNFPNVKQISRPVVELSNSLDPNWVSGFSEGDGSFYTAITSKTDQVRIVFEICLNIKDISVLHNMRKFFGVGIVNSSPERRNARFIVTRNKDVINVIVPHFNQYKLEGNKQKNLLI